MSFHDARTLTTDYARTAVDVRIRMADVHSGILGLNYLGELFASLPAEREPGRQDPAVRATRSSTRSPGRARPPGQAGRVSSWPRR